MATVLAFAAAVLAGVAFISPHGLNVARASDGRQINQLFPQYLSISRALLDLTHDDRNAAIESDQSSFSDDAQEPNRRIVRWRGGAADTRWTNAANWEGGVVPAASDVVRLDSSNDGVIDRDFDGAIAGLILGKSFHATLQFQRSLVVQGDLVIDGGTLKANRYDLIVKRYHQHAGAVFGGQGNLVVSSEAVVSSGTLVTPSGKMSTRSLSIDSAATVRMGAGSKLILTGEGDPLAGSGHLDVTTNRPNSVEYTGRTVGDVTAAAPLKTAIGVDLPNREQAFSRLSALGRQDLIAPPITPSFGKSASLTLTRKQDYPWSVVIDSANGFAYFGTLTSPGIVVKIRLSDFTSVGALVLNEGENDLRTAVIDTAHGFAYFGTLTATGIIVKVRLSDFTRVGSVDLPPQTGSTIPMACSVIDTVNGFAYFGAYTGPGAIAQIRLSDFTLNDVLVLNSGEDGLLSAVIDQVNGFAYFGTGNNPASVVKIRLSDFTRVGAAALNYNEEQLTCAVIDVANGFAYFGTFAQAASIVKIRLSDMTRVAAISPNDGLLTFLRSAVIDTAAGFAYFGTMGLPGRVMKIRLSDFTQVGTLTLDPRAEGDLLAAVIDPSAGFAYFSVNLLPGIVKVRLSDFSRVGVLALSKGENFLDSAVIDQVNGFAYFATNTNPGTIVKVRLSDFTRVGILILNETEIFLRSAAIDTINGHAYFGADRTPAQVVKVNLADFTRAGALTLNTGENGLYSATIDTTNGFVYFGTVTSPGIVVKIRLSDFTRVAALNTGENQLRSAVMDPSNGFAYFGSGSGVVVKVRLSDFTKTAGLALNSGETDLNSAAIDLANGFAYFGTFSSGIVVKVRLSDFTRVGGLTLNPNENRLFSAVMDSANGFVYFGTLTAPGRVVKVRLSDFTRVGVVTLSPGEDDLASAVIDPNQGFAYFGTSTSPGRVMKIDLSNASPTPTPSPTPSPSPNPIDSPAFFVRQHYRDFLSREPDPSGLNFWTNQITSCGNGAQCVETRRIDVSASFFLSIEFQQTGYLVERFYKVAYADASVSSKFGGQHQLLVPTVRFSEFFTDTQRIGQGVIVLQPGWEQLLESNKQAYALEFVQTARFTAANAFPTTMTPAQFVDKLNQNAGNVLSASERTTAINLFSGAGDTSNTTARAQTVRQVAEDVDLYNAEYNRAFVLAEYFGYLRRNPNDNPESTLDYTGYDFWLTKLNQFNGNYLNAEMVKAFLSSIEYRQRFGP